MPIELPDVDFQPSYPQVVDSVSAARSGNRVVAMVEWADPFWQVEMRTTSLTAGERLAVEAFRDACRGGLVTVHYRPTHQCLPKAHWGKPNDPGEGNHAGDVRASGPINPDLVAAGKAVLSRATPAWRSDPTDPTVVHAYAENEMRWIDGHGTVLKPARTRLSAAPLAISGAAWFDQGGTAPVTTVLPAIGDFPTPARIASDGNAYARRNSSMFALTTGDTVRVTVLYRAGTSPNFGVYMHYTNGAAASNMIGTAGALASSTTATGTWSNIVNTDLGGGLYRVEADFTPTATQADFQLGVSPRSAVAGQYVDVLAAQVTDGAGQAEWIFGDEAAPFTVAADTLTLIALHKNDWTVDLIGAPALVFPGHDGDLVLTAAEALNPLLAYQAVASEDGPSLLVDGTLTARAGYDVTVIASNGLTLSPGDLISMTTGDYNFMARVVSGGTVAGGTLDLTLNMPVPPYIAVGAIVRLKDPVMNARLLPGSFSMPDEMFPVASFTLVEVSR